MPRALPHQSGLITASEARARPPVQVRPFGLGPVYSSEQWAAPQCLPWGGLFRPRRRALPTAPGQGMIWRVTAAVTKVETGSMAPLPLAVTDQVVFCRELPSSNRLRCREERKNKVVPPLPKERAQLCDACLMTGCLRTAWAGLRDGQRGTVGSAGDTGSECSRLRAA